MAPSALAARFEGPIPAKYSSFGQIQYGVSTTGRIHYDPINTQNDDGCSPISSETFNLINNSNKNTTDKTPIIMVDRGNCSFVSKARQIQQAGGQVALIINHGQEFDKIFAISDDGTGADVLITAILIPEKEGNILKEFFLENKNSPQVLEQVLVNIDNKFRDVSDNVKIQVFFNPMDKKVYKLIEEINAIDSSLLDSHANIKINPVYAFDTRLETTDIKKYLFSKGRCFCGDQYCEDYDLFEPDSGEKGNRILVEAVKQKCIYMVANNKNENFKYFNYMMKFNKDCVKHGHFSQECSDNVLKEIDPSYQSEVEECYLLSFKLEGNYSTMDDLYGKCNKNTHLEEYNFYLNDKMKKGLPLLSINGNFFFGAWKTENILEAICVAFEEKSKPAVCSIVAEINLNGGKFDYEKLGSLPIKSKHGAVVHQSFIQKHAGLIIFVSLFIIMLNIGIYFLCRRYVLRKVLTEVEAVGTEKKIEKKVVDYLKCKINPEMEDLDSHITVDAKTANTTKNTSSLIKDTDRSIHVTSFDVEHL